MSKRISYLLVCLLATTAFAEEVGPVFVRDAIGVRSMAAAPRIAERAAAQPLVTLAAARDVMPEELEGIRQWNDERRTPTKIGFTRSIGEPVQVRIGRPEDVSAMSVTAGGGVIAASERGTLIWSGSVRVAGAHRMRIHLQNVNVPPGTTFWAYGTTGQPEAYGTELIDQSGEMYVPSVGGEIAYLEVEVPQGASNASFVIRDVLELLPLEESFTRGTPETLDDPSCLVDRQCVTTTSFDRIVEASGATAHLQYVKNGSGFVCSGGLLNDTDTSGFIPYLLTANHCFSAQSSATTLEAYWDYKSPSCGGTFPDLGTVTRTIGATLLATNSSTDFTLVRMNSVPSNRYFMGWTTAALSHGTKLYRLSHPFPSQFSQPAIQAYSTTFVSTTVGTCSSSGRPNFIYSTAGDGGVYGGSSGSPVMIAGGQVVGQLKGSCGPNDPTAGCDDSNSTVDGAFSQTYASIQQFLNPGTSSGCTANSTTACMLNGRFRVTVRYRGGFDNGPVDTNANVKSVTGFANPNFETGFFFFNSENNIEMLVKILDQGNTNSQGQPTIAVLFGSATPLRIELTIVDTLKGNTKVYSSNFNAMTGGTDFTAFVK